jgi:hypothetical protein
MQPQRDEQQAAELHQERLSLGQQCAQYAEGSAHEHEDQRESQHERGRVDNQGPLVVSCAVAGAHQIGDVKRDHRQNAR